MVTDNTSVVNNIIRAFGGLVFRVREIRLVVTVHINNGTIIMSKAEFIPIARNRDVPPRDEVHRNIIDNYYNSDLKEAKPSAYHGLKSTSIISRLTRATSYKSERHGLLLLISNGGEWRCTFSISFKHRDAVSAELDEDGKYYLRL